MKIPTLFGTGFCKDLYKTKNITDEKKKKLFNKLHVAPSICNKCEDTCSMHTL